jgi:hypothetical protein
MDKVKSKELTTLTRQRATTRSRGDRLCPQRRGPRRMSEDPRSFPDVVKPRGEGLMCLRAAKGCF